MKILLSIVVAIAGSVALAQDAGVMTLKLTTVKLDKTKDRAKYAPRHVIAFWVVDRNGKFVRTLLVGAKKRAKYLKEWSRISSMNRVDAVSSATLRQHTTHTVTWDGKDAAGKVVPDGEYEVRVEFTSKHSPGPLTPKGYLSFKKGSKSVELKPKDLPHFTNIELTYKPGKDVAKQ